MLTRTLLPATAAALICLFAFTGSALAAPPEVSGCTVASLPVFVAQGARKEASSVADIVEVHCERVYADASVRVSDNELYDQCEQKLSWSTPSPYAPVSGPSYTTKLDNDGNAIVALWGGPGCAEGPTLILAELVESPYLSSETTFFVGGPEPTEPGLYALTPDGESSQIENEQGSVATVLEIELPIAYAGQRVSVDAESLYDRCTVKPHLLLVGPNHKAKKGKHGVLRKVRLDNDGNTFLVLLGGESCAAGASELSATLEASPPVTVTTTFTILPPA